MYLLNYTETLLKESVNMSTRIIKLNRGDSFELKVPVLYDNFCDTDALYFAILYPHQKFEDAVILKGYTVDDLEINNENKEVAVKLTHSETKQLLSGIYYYTAKLHIGGSIEDLGVSKEPKEVRTILERTKFIVNE